MGQPIVVENRPGGANNVGTRACIEAAPDGYTICITQTEPVVYNQFLYKNLGFDPEKGSAPISNLFFISQVLFTNAKLGVKTVDELVALSKAKPGTLSYLAPSPALFLYMEWLKESKGADWVRIPFKGGGEAVNAVLNESTPIAILGVGNIIGNIQGGLFTPLAVANELKSPLLARGAHRCRTWLQGRTIARLVRPVRTGGNAEGNHRSAFGSRFKKSSPTRPSATSIS